MPKFFPPQQRKKQLFLAQRKKKVQNFDILWGGKWDHRESEIILLLQQIIHYYDDHGSHNDVRWSHNDVCSCTKLFSLNVCLIWLRIFKGCFVDL